VGATGIKTESAFDPGTAEPANGLLSLQYVNVLSSPSKNAGKSKTGKPAPENRGFHSTIDHPADLND
jgi:hypothetical protein